MLIEVTSFLYIGGILSINIRETINGENFDNCITLSLEQTNVFLNIALESGKTILDVINDYVNLINKT